MKKLICSTALLCVLGLSINVAIADDLAVEKSALVIEENDEDNVDTVQERMKLQQELLDNNSSIKGKNYEELKVLKDNGFVAAMKSLSYLQKNFNKTVINVDPFEEVNLKAALIKAFEFAMDKNATSNFIVGENTLPENIEKNDALSMSMKTFVRSLKRVDENLTLEDIQMINLEVLKGIYKKLKDDKAIGKNNPFAKFVKGMVKLHQVYIARRLADEIMVKYRASAENDFIDTRKSSSIDAGSTGNIGPATVGGSAGIHKDEGSADSSFYTISVGGGARLSVGIGTAAIGAEVGASVDVTKSAIFYSLEQLLDSGKIKKGVLTSKDVKETLKSRKKMQEKEKKLLSTFGTNVEGYLKMIGAVPVSTYLEWPKLTKAAPAEETVNVSKSVDATISALEVLGLNVVENDDVKTWRRPSGYLTLISDDCSPSDGLTAETIVKFLGDKYDKSSNYIDKDKKDNNVNEVVLPIILGDIRAYNTALNILAENKSDKKASERKHGIEERWLPKSKLTSEGRLGVLKSMIATISVLRETASNEREIELFKQMYEEISRLAKLLEFSKNKVNRSATFMTESTAHNKAIQASASVTIPKFGDTQFSFTRSICRDNPFQEENGDYMTFDVILPCTPVGIVGAGVLGKSFNQYRRLMGKSHATSDFGGTFGLAIDGINLLKDQMLIPDVLGDVTGSFVGTAKLTVSVVRVDAPEPIAYPTRTLSKDGPVMPKEVRPLPGKELITRKENRWTTLYVKGGAYVNSDIGKDFKLASLTYSSSVGKEFLIIGSDTLAYLSCRFNAFSLGLQDSKDAMSPWYTLKKRQKKQLIKLFENVTKDEANVIYEVQNMYNSIMDNIDEQDTKAAKKCTEAFKEFLSACKEVATAENDGAKQAAYDKASKQFDKILKMNFDYNFMSDYKKAYQVAKD